MSILLSLQIALIIVNFLESHTNPYNSMYQPPKIKSLYLIITIIYYYLYYIIRLDSMIIFKINLVDDDLVGTQNYDFTRCFYYFVYRFTEYNNIFKL